MAEVQLYFFGSFRAIQHDQVDLSFHGRKAVALLIFLVTEPAAHSRDSLIGLFWPELPEKNAKNNLRVSLARLSKGLGEQEQPWLLTDRHTVKLNPAVKLFVDTQHFTELIEAAHRHSHESRKSCATCHEKLVKAAELYRSEFLEGFYLDGCLLFEEWQHMQREQHHLAALEVMADISAYLEQKGDYAKAERYAKWQLKLEPLREDAHRSLMRLLALQGQQSAALKQFKVCQAHLESELGLAPEHETKELYEQIKAAKFKQTKPLSTPQPSTHIEHKHNLPSQLTPFFGRETELLELEQILLDRQYRLVSIVGLGGIGKTRLALECAFGQVGQFRDGVFYVPLVGVTAKEDIAFAIAQSLGLSLGGAKGSALAQLVQGLKSKELLLVLDNFEQLSDSFDLLLEFLASIPELFLLLTSRERLNVQAETLLELKGLPVPQGVTGNLKHFASVRLFVDRAHRLNKDFRLSESVAESVVRICKLVEGLPLALEIAASWVKDFSCEEIAEVLEGNLDFLETSFRDVPAHHRSMRVVLERSWELATTEEKQVLACLSVCKGGFGIEAAKQIAGANLLVLRKLSYKTLLLGVSSKRYEMHELLRQFAFEKLQMQEAFHYEGIRSLHSEVYLTLLVEQMSNLGAAASEVIGLVEQDLENVRQAWSYAIAHKNLEKLSASFVALAQFYNQAGLFEEGQRVFSEAVEEITLLKMPNSDAKLLAELRVGLLCELIEFVNSQVNSESILPLTQEVIQLAASLGQPHSAGRAYFQWGRLALTKGDSTTALGLLNKALDLAKESNAPKLQGLILRFIGNVWRQRGNYQKFSSYLHEALRLQRQEQNLEEVQTLLMWLGVYGLKQHLYYESFTYLQQALELSETMIDPFKKFNTISAVGSSKARFGSYEEARVVLEKAQQGFHELAVVFQRVMSLADLSIVYGKLGEFELALERVSEAERLARNAELKEMKALAISKRCYALIALDFFEEAKPALEEGLVLWQELENQPSVIESHACFIYLYLQEGRFSKLIPHLEIVLEYLEAQTLDGIDEPSRLFLNVYKALNALEDDRAITVLQQAHAWIQARAAAISNEALRSSYLTSVLENKELISIYKQHV